MPEFLGVSSDPYTPSTGSGDHINRRLEWSDDGHYGRLLELIEGPEWHKNAACKGEGPEMFYPEPGRRDYAAIKQKCSTCTVRIECLAYGIDDPHGWWGGLSPRQRQRRRRGIVEKIGRAHV